MQRLAFRSEYLSPVAKNDMRAENDRKALNAKCLYTLCWGQFIFNVKILNMKQITNLAEKLVRFDSLSQDSQNELIEKYGHPYEAQYVDSSKTDKIPSEKDISSRNCTTENILQHCHKKNCAVCQKLSRQPFLMPFLRFSNFRLSECKIDQQKFQVEFETYNRFRSQMGIARVSRNQVDKVLQALSRLKLCYFDEFSAHGQSRKYSKY